MNVNAKSELIASVYGFRLSMPSIMMYLKYMRMIGEQNQKSNMQTCKLYVCCQVSSAIEL